MVGRIGNVLAKSRGHQENRGWVTNHFQENKIQPAWANSSWDSQSFAGFCYHGSRSYHPCSRIAHMFWLWADRHPDVSVWEPEFLVAGPKLSSPMRSGASWSSLRTSACTTSHEMPWHRIRWVILYSDRLGYHEFTLGFHPLKLQLKFMGISGRVK